MTATHAVGGLSFSAEQLELRRQTLGASEIAAVAGLDKHRSPVAVWAEKRGLVPAFAGNEYTEWGLRLEDAIARKYGEVTDAGLSTSSTIVKDDWMSATPDRIAVIDGEPRVLEIKRFGEHRAAEFGPAGTDQVPDTVAAQVHWQMAVTGFARADIAVLLGQADFRIYTIWRDLEIEQHFFEIGQDFWMNYVVPGVEPPMDGSRSSLAYLNDKYRAHDQRLVDPTPESVELGRQLLGVRGQIRSLEAQEAELEAHLKNAIGDAAGINGIATWKAPRSGYIAWKPIAEALGANAKPELVLAHTNPPVRRFLLTMKEG